jgi:DNA-binding transcriptional LysR family regulator
MQIDVEALRALLLVVEHGSITRAARALHLSRSAVSWRMKRLEEHVGQELIVRDGRALRPSRAGRAILDDARTLVETHDRIARRLDSADLTGDVTVGADNDVDVPP